MHLGHYGVRLDPEVLQAKGMFSGLLELVAFCLRVI